MLTKILRLPEVLAITGLSRSTIYRLLGSNSFPKPVKLSERTIGWFENDIELWIQSLLDQSKSDITNTATGTP